MMYMKPASYIKSHPIIFSIIIFLFVVSSAYGLKTSDTRASLGLPFGGRIVFALPCFCSFTMWLMVYNIGSPQYTGTYVYTIFTIPHMWYQFFRGGPYILGSYVPSGGAGCYFYVPPFSCVQLHTSKGIITEAGTSL